MGVKKQMNQIYLQQPSCEFRNIFCLPKFNLVTMHFSLIFQADNLRCVQLRCTTSTAVYIESALCTFNRNDEGSMMLLFPMTRHPPFLREQNRCSFPYVYLYISARAYIVVHKKL